MIGSYDLHIDRIKNCIKTNKFDHALFLLKKIKNEKSKYYYYLSLIDFLRGNFKSALFKINQAIQSNNSDFESFLLCGNIYKSLHDFENSLEMYRRSLDLNPRFFDAHYNLGLLYYEQENFSSSIFHYEKSLEINSKNIEALVNIATVFQKIEKFETAIHYYQIALSIDNNSFSANLNIGACFSEIYQYHDALQYCHHAVFLNSKSAEAYLNRAIAHHGLYNFSSAEKDYLNALQINQFYDKAKMNLAMLYLLFGRYEEGFFLYESRNNLSEKNKFSCENKKQWNGEKLNDDELLLVHHEQGLGDTIQFIRYALVLKNHVEKFVVVVQDKLVELLNNSFDTIIICNEKNIPPYTHYISLMSLPYILKTSLSNLPVYSSYLIPKKEKLNYWKQKINNEKMNIGICWQGSTTKIDRGRSFPLDLFIPISQISNLNLISLHKGEGESDLVRLENDLNIMSLGDEFDSGSSAFLDSSAVIHLCDLVITSDTSIAHLAAALGKDVWVVLQYVPDWRWMLNSPESPWYPSVRLFRQENPGDWETVFHKILNELTNVSHVNLKENNMNLPLIPVSWGELIDKITILEIKSQNFKDENKIQDIIFELSLLIEKAKPVLEADETIWNLKDALFEINNKLWDVEDKLRLLEGQKQFQGEFITLARSVYILNDQRADLKKEINVRLGSQIIEHKSYQPYH